MRLVISGDKKNRELFSKAIENSPNIKVLLTSKDKESEDLIYIIEHPKLNHDGDLSGTVINDRLIIWKKEIGDDINVTHLAYFEAFDNEDILTEELKEMLSKVHETIDQSEKEHEVVMFIFEGMIRDVIKQIKKYDLCEILEVGEMTEGHFIRIRNENITDYKHIDILMDDNYSVLYEKKITNNYGEEWKSYSNLFWCSKFEIKLLTLEEFKRREFDKQLEAEQGTRTFININAKNIFTPEAVLKAGYEELPNGMFKKGKAVVHFSSDKSAAKIYINGEESQSYNLSDDQLKCLLDIGEIVENGAN